MLPAAAHVDCEQGRVTTKMFPDLKIDVNTLTLVLAESFGLRRKSRHHPTENFYCLNTTTLSLIFTHFSTHNFVILQHLPPFDVEKIEKFLCKQRNYCTFVQPHFPLYLRGIVS